MFWSKPTFSLFCCQLNTKNIRQWSSRNFSSHRRLHGLWKQVRPLMLQSSSGTTDRKVHRVAYTVTVATRYVLPTLRPQISCFTPLDRGLSSNKCVCLEHRDNTHIVSSAALWFIHVKLNFHALCHGFKFFSIPSSLPAIFLPLVAGALS